MEIAWCILLIVLGCCRPALGEVVVVAGSGAADNNGDAGPALQTNVGDPFGVVIGPDGALYITEVRHHRVRRLDLNSGQLTTVAGCGEKGYAGDGGPAVAARMNEPYEVRFDRDGNLLVVEMQNHLVRRVDRQTGAISTFAGTGKRGFGGDGGPATAAQFNQPHSIALDRAAAVYVADIGNHRIRRIDPASGMVETIAGNGDRRMPHDGQPARGRPILGPRALYIDGDTLWIALREGHSIWRMNLADGILHHVAGIGAPGYSGDGGPATAAKLNGPKGIAVDAQGNIFVADTENHAIRRIDARTGVITTVAGGHIAAAEVETFNRPHGICVAPDGAIYVGDTLRHRIVRIQ
jgi:DNA-binding beta-propeller fold protein YncE